MDDARRLEELERIVDEAGLSLVLDSLALIAFEKSDHIRSCYQRDDNLVKQWRRAGDLVTKCASKIEV